MNLRNVGDYNVGLDIGTGSVGWAVTDAEGNLCHFKGKPTWGSRIFPSAHPASEARGYRGLRRRYSRRKWRLGLLQGIFSKEIESVDPEFFIRLDQSALFPEDREAGSSDYLYTLFNDDDFDEKAYFDRFPTIYHLRKRLMETDEKADLRLVYLALHSIVKHRGNFLQQDKTGLTSENANIDAAVDEFCMALQEHCEEFGLSCGVLDNESGIIKALGDVRSSRSKVKESVQKLLGLDEGDGALDKKQAGSMAKALSAAIVGLSAEMADIFFAFEEKPAEAKTKIYLSKDDEADAFEEICPDAGLPLFEAMKKVYSSYVLQEILSSDPGNTLSANKVKDYDRYGEDLRLLKDLFKEHAPGRYDEFFRGEFYLPTKLHPQRYVYDKSKAQGYTKYDVDHSWPYDEFRKAVEKALGSTSAAFDERYLEMVDRLKAGKFLRRLKTSDNGAIPFQLHLEEMQKIIANQGAHHPFLECEKEKLESLVRFRIPYYVGPLTMKNARKDSRGNSRFAWAQRIEGKENESIKPWNWEEIIDKDKSATAFIQRMTGTCTYLQGEPVLPKCSLLYEEYCVLNELNGAQFTQDGDKWRRFDYQDRVDMVRELFSKGKVSYKRVADWMRGRGHANVHVRGGQGEKGFESKLGSYAFFATKVFDVEEISKADYPMIEEVILWSTLFEDRSIFKEKLKRKYGERLSADQINKIVRKRFTGWGRLSGKLLTRLRVETDNGSKSIMDVLREGNPNNSGLSKAMVFMEVLHEDALGFNRALDEENKKRILDSDGFALEYLPGSPALRRSINQALGIVEEISKIAGHAPKNVFIEVAREDDIDSRGRRTQKRYDRLKEAMARLREDAPEYWEAEVSSELSSRAKANDDLNERLTLYFMQGGKSLYSGVALEIGRLSEYEVDHIIPQSYIKDDSFENKALVLKSENQEKSNQMLLDPKRQKRMKPYWDALLQARLIGQKKHTSLLRDHISEKQMKGFIARQLVETRQVMKTVQGLLEEMYPETCVVPVKAGLSHELRDKLGLVKCREINDFHHAHDALLAAEVGRFIQKRHPGMHENPIGYTKVMRDFVKNESERVRKGGAPGTASFVIASFMSSGFDEKTGELFRDDWSAERECAKLREYFDYRQCFISRMPEETAGAFWAETIYSPRGGKKTPAIPLKKGLDPMKYGGYSGTEFAYFFIYRARKKGKECLEFAPMPVHVASKAAFENGAAEAYARSLTEANGAEFIEMVRPKVYKYQLIEMDGSRLYLTAIKGARNATQFAASVNEARIASLLFTDGQIDDNEINELFLMVVKSLVKYSGKLFEQLKVAHWRDDFFGLDKDSRILILKALIAIGNGETNMADLSTVGGGKCAGYIQPTYSKQLTKDGGITFIDQSITGMFERRTHIGL